MLVLTRKLMEKLFIGDDICVTVVRLEGGQVRLGIEAPREITVVRAELDPIMFGPPRTIMSKYHRPARAAPPRPPGVPRPRPRTAILAEPVTDAADRLDKVGRLAQLLAKALDVDVDGALQNHRVLADGRVHQLVTCERPARPGAATPPGAELGRRSGSSSSRTAHDDCAGRSPRPGSRSPRRGGSSCGCRRRSSFLMRWIRTFML